MYIYVYILTYRYAWIAVKCLQLEIQLKIEQKTCREKRSERQTSFGTNHVETEQTTNPGNNSNSNKQTNAVEKKYTKF